MAIELTVAMVKPCGIRLDILNYALGVYEAHQLRPSALTIVEFWPSEMMEFYQEHKDKPFFPNLIDHMTSGPCAVIVLEGENAVSKVRSINGETNPMEASPVTIRGRFKHYFDENKRPANFVHGSDSQESAAREIQLVNRLQLRQRRG